MATRILVPGLLAAFALVGSFAPIASAQSYHVSGYGPSASVGYGGFHTSTAAEGYLRGQAAVIQARGVASLYNAQALSEREVACNQYIENRRAYLALRADQQEALAVRYERRREESLRRVAQRQRLAAERAAAQETAGKVAIDWPATLNGERYASIRKEIEALANLRIALGDDAGDASEVAIRHAIRELAHQIMVDEGADRISDEESQVVRPFVRGLAANIFRATPTRPSTLTVAGVDSAQR